MQTVIDSPKQSSISSLSSRSKAGHSYIYVIGAAGTAVIDPSNWQLIVIAPGIKPGHNGFLVDNHYRDETGRLWSVSSAIPPVMPWDESVPGTVSIWDAKTFRNENTIELGQNVVNTVGLTPDGEFAVVPLTTANQLNVYDTGSYAQVATIRVGLSPWDMMLSADGKYCCEPDANSDTLTIVDPKTWKVVGKVPTVMGAGPLWSQSLPTASSLLLSAAATMEECTLV